MISKKEKNFISAVIYVYNCEATIQEKLETINDVLKENFDKYEIICVNDASSDDSVKVIKEVSKKLGNSMVSVVNMSYYQGLEAAMNAGTDLAIGDFVYEFDNIMDDYDPNLIMEIYRKSLEGYDIVSATSKSNKLKTSSIYYKIFNKWSNVQYELQTETFRILSRRAINRIHSMSEKIPYRKAIYSNCGLELYNFEYETNSDVKREFNKQTKKNRQETAITSLILFTNIGYKFSITMSLIMIIATILMGIYTIAIFATDTPVQGWTTTMLFLSFCFMGLFIIMAIVIKYLEILLQLTFSKNKYMIESINKLN